MAYDLLLFIFILVTYRILVSLEFPFKQNTSAMLTNNKINSFWVKQIIKIIFSISISFCFLAQETF